MTAPEGYNRRPKLTALIELLRQFPFPFLGALVATLAFARTVIQSPRKKLRAEELWAVRVHSKYSEVPENIAFDDEELPTEELFEVVVDVENAGNQDIETKHYERPLTLRFGEQARVIIAEVIEEEPQGIRASLDVYSDKVTINPVLLNAGDLVCLGLLVYRYDDLRAEGRVVGVKRVDHTVIWEKARRGHLVTSVGGLVALGILIILDFFPQVVSGPVDAAILGFATAGAVLSTRGAFRLARDHRKLRRREEALQIKLQSIAEAEIQTDAQEDAHTEEPKGSRASTEARTDDGATG